MAGIGSVPKSRIFKQSSSGPILSLLAFTSRWIQSSSVILLGSISRNFKYAARSTEWYSFMCNIID